MLCSQHMHHETHGQPSAGFPYEQRHQNGNCGFLQEPQQPTRFPWGKGHSSHPLHLRKATGSAVGLHCSLPAVLLAVSRSAMSGSTPLPHHRQLLLSAPLAQSCTLPHHLNSCFAGVLTILLQLALGPALTGIGLAPVVEHFTALLQHPVHTLWCGMGFPHVQRLSLSLRHQGRVSTANHLMMHLWSCEHQTHTKI